MSSLHSQHVDPMGLAGTDPLPSLGADCWERVDGNQMQIGFDRLGGTWCLSSSTVEYCFSDGKMWSG